MKHETERQNQNLQTRPPVVVVLGHVDHGKSTLIEEIKKIKITDKESGGITQHIGAYEIEHQGRKITFIDTPGHEAFSAMRSRGTNIADIAILVIAADEGVKAQTKEALSFIKKSEIPMIVAINKIDKPQSNPEKVKEELAKENVLVESRGGKVPSVNISAKTGERISELLDLILLVAEIEDLKGNFSKSGEGVIIEAYLDGLRGPTATLLLKDGILRTGDIVGTDSTCGRVKILEDFQGNSIVEAYPSQPVVVIGFENVPQVGEKFKVFTNIESARNYIKEKEKKTEIQPAVSFIEQNKKVLNLILKVDVVGSIEPIEEILRTLPQEKVVIRILKGEAGDINEFDLKMAQSARAIVVAFRVKISPRLAKFAELRKIKIMKFEVIYELVQAVREEMEKLIKPELVRKEIGEMKVLEVFRTEKKRQVIGGKVIEGELKKNTLIEILRDEEKIGEGKVINLQRNKKDVEQVKKGEECGLLYEGEVKIEKGDIVKFYIEEKKKGEL